MNTFELKIIATGGASAAPRKIAQEIWIDGVHLDEPHAVDVCELVRSLFRPGEFFFFTCGCGEPGCAGIWDGIQVRQLPGRILWRFRRPVRTPEFLTNDEYAQWKLKAPLVDFTFDRDQVLAAMDGSLAELWFKPDDAEFSPNGFGRAQLGSLDAYQEPSGYLDDSGRRRLYFLVDEASPWLLEGQFIGVDELGTSTAFESRFREWQGQQAMGVPMNAAHRLAWLEEARAIALCAYQDGLPEDIDILLIASQWNADDQLDPWCSESRLVSRQWMDPPVTLERPYLCLSADRGKFAIWLDDTPEAKNQRSRFVGYGSRIVDHSPFQVPFAFEKALSDWASTMPDSRTSDPWDHWFLGRPVGRDSLCPFSWPAFHAEGQRLAKELGGMVGCGTPVLYELPWGSPPFCDTRRIEVCR